MNYILVISIISAILFFILKSKKEKINLDSTIDLWKQKFLDEGFEFKIINDPYNIKVRDLYTQFGADRINVGGRIFTFNFGYKDDFGYRLINKALSANSVEEFYKTIYNSEILKKELINKHGLEKANALICKNYAIGETTKDDILSIRGYCRDTKVEQLKTKTKTTLYYGFDKSNDYYVFDNELLVKYVDRM